MSHISTKEEEKEKRRRVPINSLFFFFFVVLYHSSLFRLFFFFGLLAQTTFSPCANRENIGENEMVCVDLECKSNCYSQLCISKKWKERTRSLIMIIISFLRNVKVLNKTIEEKKGFFTKTSTVGRIWTLASVIYSVLYK